MTRAPWYLAGPLIGLCIVILRAMLNRPFGVLGGYIDLADRPPRGTGIALWLLLGFIVGGTMYGIAGGTFSVSFTYPGFTWPAMSPQTQITVLVAAGIAMGFGARSAGGCTSGHGLTGTSLGSPASIVATLTFMSVGVLLTHLLLGRF